MKNCICKMLNKGYVINLYKIYGVMWKSWKLFLWKKLVLEVINGIKKIDFGELEVRE